jgi:hypothetical protein
MKNTYRILADKPERKRSVVRTRCRCEDNIEMDLEEIKWDNVDWIHVAQDKEWW